MRSLRVALLLLSAVAATVGRPASGQADPPGAVTPSETTAPQPSALDRAEESLSARRAALESRTKADLAEADGLVSEAESAPPQSDEADLAYDHIVIAVTAARSDFADALEALDASSEIPDDPSQEQRAAELRTLEHELLSTTASARYERMRLLNDARLHLLENLSPDKRSAVLGIGREGIAQLLREVKQAGLIGRWYVATRLRQWTEAPAAIADVFTVGAAFFALVKIFFIVLIALFLRRRGSTIYAFLRDRFVARLPGVRGKRLALDLLAAVSVAGPWSLWLATVYLVSEQLGSMREALDVRALLLVLYAVGGYRLAIDLVYAVVVRVARRYRLTLDAMRRELLIRSVRSVIRVAVALLFLTLLAQLVVGRGYLYHSVRQFAWVAFALVALRIVGRWRGVVTAAYLKAQPEGALADRVRSSRDRWYGFFVAVFALGWLAGRAGVVLARDFALGFDQTRRGLAFLFRRQIERQAEKQGYADGDLSKLPESVVHAFSEEFIDDEARRVDRFPGRDRFSEAISAWSSGRSGGSLLLYGEKGIGKTSWLAAAPVDGIVVERITLADRVTTPAALASVLGRGLAVPETDTDLEQLRTLLLDGPPRLIALDQAQNLFLASVGGYRALESFAELVDATQRRVFWLVVMNEFAREHLNAVRPDLLALHHQQRLEAWTENEIAALIKARAAVSGFELNYEDLLLERAEGIATETRLLETEHGYSRLLWDFSGGNPRVALHFLLRSLVPESDRRLRVRLFRSPSGANLEKAGETALFLLAALMGYENLTEEEAAITTRFPLPVCRSRLHRLADLGAVAKEGGRYRVTTHWQVAVTRLLRRKNLLAD